MPNPRVPDQLRHAPFTAEQAAGAGVSRSALRSAPWRKLLRNVWVHADLTDDRDLRLAAVRLVLAPHAFICGPTAAWIHGVDVQGPKSDLIWIGYREGSRPRPRSGCWVQMVSVADDELALVGGVMMTSPLRTAFDCARWLAVSEGVVIVDALSHAGVIALPAFARFVATHRALRGVRRADAAVRLADAGSESPMESRLRVLLELAGLPRPATQVEIKDGFGRFVARADLGYPSHRLAIEYDGAWHWEQRREDDRRRDAMRAAGWTVIVFSGADYYQNPRAITATVRAALAAARG
jgi:very-short-patch-repair endonuclease